MLPHARNDTATCLRRTARVRSLSILLTAMVNVMPINVWAAVRVEGSPNSLSLQVENAPISEVLSALGVKLRNRAPSDFTRIKTGAYSGTLRQVLARLLDGYDYIITDSGDNIQVVVLGASAAFGTAPGPVAPVGSPAFPTAAATK